jgi:hypothetical protein
VPGRNDGEAKGAIDAFKQRRRVRSINGARSYGVVTEASMPDPHFGR